jgi:hypothetical protein
MKRNQKKVTMVTIGTHTTSNKYEKRFSRRTYHPSSVEEVHPSSVEEDPPSWVEEVHPGRLVPVVEN